MAIVEYLFAGLLDMKNFVEILMCLFVERNSHHTCMVDPLYSLQHHSGTGIALVDHA